MIQEKIDKLKNNLSSLPTPDDRYRYLIDLGRSLPPFDSAHETPLHRVPGCQSVLYLHTALNTDGTLRFTATADALISKGLAALLISIYNEETPLTLLQTPPTFLHDFGLFAALSPNRSHGLAQIFLRMRKDALDALPETAVK